MFFYSRENKQTKKNTDNDVTPWLVADAPFQSDLQVAHKQNKSDENPTVYIIPTLSTHYSFFTLSIA